MYARMRYQLRDVGLYYRSADMSTELSMLMLFSPIIVFTVAAFVVAVDGWWQNRGRLKR